MAPSFELSISAKIQACLPKFCDPLPNLCELLALVLETFKVSPLPHALTLLYHTLADMATTDYSILAVMPMFVEKV